MRDEKGGGRKWRQTNVDNSNRDTELKRDQYESINSGYEKIICDDKLSNYFSYDLQIEGEQNRDDRS